MGGVNKVCEFLFYDSDVSVGLLWLLCCGYERDVVCEVVAVVWEVGVYPPPWGVGVGVV